MPAASSTSARPTQRPISFGFTNGPLRFHAPATTSSSAAKPATSVRDLCDAHEPLVDLVGGQIHLIEMRGQLLARAAL
jgi:hypothetical protein